MYNFNYVFVCVGELCFCMSGPAGRQLNSPAVCVDPNECWYLFKLHFYIQTILFCNIL